MIVIQCARCGRRSLLPLSMLTAFDRTTGDGRVRYELEYTCWCGHPGSKSIAGPRLPVHT
jgi:hypothetical protein